LIKKGPDSTSDWSRTRSNSAREGAYSCTVKEVEWSPEFNELYLLNPLSDILPGRIFDGNSFADASYKPILLSRDSIRISVSIPVRPGERSSAWILNPNSIGEIRDGINGILDRTVKGATPAFVNFKIEQVESSSEVDKHLAANFKGWGAKVSGSYDFNSLEKQTKVLVRFQQIYYTIDTDPVAQPCKLFNPLPKIDEIQKNLGSTSPVYVSSVNFGRAVYYVVESNESFSKVEKALNASFSKWGTKTGIELSQQDKDVINSSSIKGLLVGGAADGAVKTINGLESLRMFIEEGGDFSENNIGVPISYRMKFVSDNTDAKIVFAGKYTIRNCEYFTEDKTIEPLLAGSPYDGCPILYHGDNEFGSDAVRITGTISLEVSNGGKTITAKIEFDFNESINDNHPGDTRAKIEDELIVYELNEPNKIIVGIESNPVSYIDYTPSRNGNHNLPFSSNFIKRIIAQANGEDKNDLPCSGYTEDPDGRAFIRIFFNKINVKVRSL
jgi:Thiol-activated cytolysin